MIVKSAITNYLKKNNPNFKSPKPKRLEGKIWVKPHKRGSRVYNGFWRNLKGSIKKALSRESEKSPKTVIRTSKGDLSIDDYHKKIGGTIEDHVKRKKHSAAITSKAMNVKKPKIFAEKRYRRKSKNVILTGPQKPRKKKKSIFGR